MYIYFNKIIKVVSFYIKAKVNKKILPLCYFDEVKNVGDELNLRLISEISGRTPVKPPSLKYCKHLCAVGSVLSSMNKNSIVWGSGLISEDAILSVAQLGDIRAVRGHLTKLKIEERFNIHLNVPLGDPALLIPMFIQPKHYNKKYRFGLVLHYVDKNHPVKLIAENLGGKIIDVALTVEEFVNEINQCEVILSSSMHGLILSDAYNIPNQRIVLSDEIIGGDFKFKDYYSTTSQPNSKSHILKENASSDDINNAISLASVKNTKLNLDALLNAFPNDL